MKAIILTILVSTFSSIHAGPGGTGGGSFIELHSINNLRELIIVSNDTLKEAILSQIENLTLEKSDEVKYIKSNIEALEYLKMRELESVQLSDGLIITNE